MVPGPHPPVHLCIPESIAPTQPAGIGISIGWVRRDVFSDLA
jgi:hypothetical protein